MAIPKDYKPRLSVEITEEQNRKLQMLLPHSLKSSVVRAIVDTLIHLLAESGANRAKVIALIINKDFDLAKATLQEQEREAKDGIAVTVANSNRVAR